MTATTHRRRLRTGAALAAVAGLLATGAAGAQEAPPAAEPSPLAALRRSPDAGPFASGETLAAQPLRGFRADVAHLIFSAAAGGEIPVAALATPVVDTAPDGAVRVPLFVEIDGTALMRHSQEAEPRIEVYVYAVDAGGAVAGHLATAFAFDAGRLAERAARGGFKLYGDLALPPGSYTLRVLVRNPQSAAYGKTVVPLTVASPAEAAAIFADPAERWLPVVAGDPGAPYPFVAGGRALSPAARPVLTAGSEDEAYVFGAATPAGAWSGEVEVLGLEDERIVGRAPVAAAPGAAAVRFKVPELEPGAYRLRLTLAGGAVRTPAVPVWILKGDARERDLVWTDLRWLIAAAAPGAATTAATTAAEPPAATHRSGRRLRQMAARYREVLAALGGGERTGDAAAALLELETSTLGRDREQLEVLQAAEAQVAEEVAARAVEGLAPVLALHLDVYRTYRDRRLPILTVHARMQVERLAALYAGRGGAPAVAADALACLGSELQASGLYGLGQRFFLLALAHDPRHRGALLGLGVSYEKGGHYREAAAYFERLAALDGDGDGDGAGDGEARLRLAINLDRLGDRVRAGEILTALAAGDGAGWVRAVASQQLARRALDTGALEQAAALLAGAVAAHPDEPGLALLLAHVYDRLKRPDDALALVRAVRPRPGAEHESAAKVYDSWPRAAFVAAETALAAAAGRGALAGALDEQGS